MKNEPIHHPRIRAHLKAVAAALHPAPAATRDQVLDDLTRHIRDAMEDLGHLPTDGEIDALLADMDPPESFRACSDVVTPSQPARRGPSGWAWFILALVFLGLNGWGVRHLLHGAANRAPERPATVVQGNIDAGTAIAPDTALAWTFSQDMVDESSTGTVIDRAPLTLDPAVPGRFTWETPRTLMFRPAANWPLCHFFEARLDPALLDLDGYPVSGDRIFQFYTEGLRLLAVEQADLDATRRVTVRLQFNAPPDRASLRRALRMTTGDNQPLEWEHLGGLDTAEVHVRTAPVPADRLTVHLAHDLAPASGTRGMESAQQRMLAIVDRLQFRRVHPVTPALGDPSIHVSFSEPIDIAQAQGFIEVNPSVPISLSSMSSWQGGGCILQGPFEPGRAYTVLFRAGLLSRNGSTLTRDVERSVQLPDRPPSLIIPVEGRYLSPQGRLHVPFTAVNIRQVEASLQPVPAVNLVPFTMREAGRYSGHYYWSGDAAHADRLGGGPLATAQIDTAGAMNEAVRGTVDVRPWVGETPRGVWLLTLREDQGHRSTARLIVVTDLGLSARMGQESAWVWVTSVADASPVAGAEVTLWSESNEPLASGRTDERGLAELPLKGMDPAHVPLLVTAAHEGDLSYLSLATPPLPTNETGSRPFLAEGYEAYVFTDRGVYRPGETMVLQSLLRDRLLEAPGETFPVQFRMFRPDGRLFRERTVMLDAAGAAGMTLEVPEYAHTGHYTVRLALPGGSRDLGATVVAVEDFVPPQIAVKVQGPEGRSTPEEPVVFSASARHLFGRAADGLPVEGHVQFEPVPFRPAGWEGWRFGDAEKEFAPSWSNLGRTRLDTEGEAQWSVSLDPGWRPPAALQVAFRATVTEHGGRPVSAYSMTEVDLYPFYIGLQLDREGGRLRVGEEQVLSVAAVTPDGSPDPTAPRLRAVLARAEWVSFMRREPSGHYAWISERRLDPVREQVIALQEGRATWTVNPPQPGSYVLTVTDPLSGASSSMALEASSPDQQWVSWAQERPDRVELSFDREEYRPGDTARLQVKSPFPGTALITLENDAVLETRVLDLEANTAEVVFTVQDHFVPNVFAHISVVRPIGRQSVWRTPRAAGSASMRVVPEGRRLALTLTAPDAIRPLTSLAVDIAVRDEQGQPSEADLVVFAVDEGICALTSFRLPDPLAFFLATRWPGVQGYDLFSLLMPELEERAQGEGSSAPGDEVALQRRLNPMSARRFKPVALWSGPLRSDAAGNARAVFDVPEFTGQLRLMAVAWTPRHAGSAAAPVQVKRPVVVQAALPRFLAPDDVCRVPVTVFNETGAAVTGRVRLTTGGPLSVKLPESTLELAAGAHGDAVFELRGGALPGLALCSVEVEAGDEHYLEQFEIAVRPASVLETEIRHGMVPAGEEARLTAPGDWIPATVHREVYAAGRPELRLLGALDYLLRYPYGCLEQTVSASFPLLYLPDLANAVQPQSMGNEEAEALALAGVYRVLGMQQPDGGFSPWPGSGSAYPWGSLYAVHFLTEAQRSGLPVPAEQLKAALDWVRGRLDRTVAASGDREDPAWMRDMEGRAYACHILALAGRPEAGWTERLREQAGLLGPGARAHVGSALLLTGRPREAGALFTGLAGGLPDTDGERRSTGGTLAGPVRDAALLLAAWSALEPAHPEAMALAARLESASRNGRWATTHDTAWAVMALGKHLRALPERPRAFTASLRLPDRAPIPFDEGTPLRRGPEADEAGALWIGNDGPGDVYYSVRYEGLPTVPRLEERDQGLRVRRTMLDVEGKGWPANRPVHRGDLIVVRIDLEVPGNRAVDNLVVTDLLPAGMEIENPDLATSATLPWLADAETPWCLHRELRDDRLLLFTGPVRGKVSYYYAARAVTEGSFIHPPIAAEAMYDPGLQSLHGLERMEILP